MKHVLIGVLAGLSVGMVIAVAVVHFDLESEEEVLSKGWHPHELLVASHALHAGDPVSKADFRTVDVAEQYVTASNLTEADLPALQGKRLAVGLIPAEPVRWADFAGSSAKDALTACTQAVTPEVAKAGDEVKTQISAVITKFRSTDPVPDLPMPNVKSGDVPVVVAARKVSEDAVLTAEDPTIRQVPFFLVTPSLVPAKDREALIGAHTYEPLQPNDLLTWQMLYRGEGEPTITVCVKGMNKKVGDAERRKARQLARATLHAEEK